MEPKLPAPNRGPEQTPSNYGQNLEQLPMPPTPETGFDQGAEKIEQRSEATPVGVQAMPAAAQVAVAPTLPPVVISDDAASAPTDDSPIVAADEDLIEKEWVEKAKKIIATTKDDPYRREQEVGKLQADYLRKRYGKELGASQ
jgi:hypothetical protein